MSNQELTEPLSSAQKCGTSMAKPQVPSTSVPAAVALSHVSECGECTVQVNDVLDTGRETRYAAAMLTIELSEALTATGNYLESAAHLLAIESPHQHETLAGMLDRSVIQFDRAVEIVRRLRAGMV